MLSQILEIMPSFYCLGNNGLCSRKERRTNKKILVSFKYLEIIYTLLVIRRLLILVLGRIRYPNTQSTGATKRLDKRLKCIFSTFCWSSTKVRDQQSPQRPEVRDAGWWALTKASFSQRVSSKLWRIWASALKAAADVRAGHNLGHTQGENLTIDPS